MKSLREYVQGARAIVNRIDTAVIRLLFNKNYDPNNAVASSRIAGIDYHSSERRNPLATSFLGRDYLLDGFGDLSRRESNKRV